MYAKDYFQLLLTIPVHTKQGHFNLSCHWMRSSCPMLDFSNKELSVHISGKI